MDVVYANAPSRDAGRGPAQTVSALRHAIGQRHPDLLAHGMAVGRLSASTGRALGFHTRQIALLKLAGELHDVGKLAVATAVLSKRGPLTPAEWAAVHRHPTAGAEMLAAAGLAEIAAWVLAHHERPDGLGYPAGLSGAKIPLEARILTVADAFDAMTNDRVYRPALTPQAAVAELQRGAGTQFDAQAVQAFCAELSISSLPVRL